MSSLPLHWSAALLLASVAAGAQWLTGALQSYAPHSAIWDYGSSSSHLPALDETAPSFWRIKGKELDLSYPEIASLLRQKMPRKTQPKTIRALSAQILRLCAELDFQPSFILAVIEHESAFKPRALSNRGAVGLMQLLPPTASEVARRIGLSSSSSWPRDASELLRDPVTNVTLGMHYLAQLKKQFKTAESTLAAYNLGPGRWAELQKNPHRIRPGQTFRYVALIQRTRERMKVDGREAWRPELAARLGAGAWL